MIKTNVSYGWDGRPLDKYNFMAIGVSIFTFLCTLVIITTILGFSGYIETHYNTTAEVLSTENNSVLLVDGAGYVWEVINRPDLKKGDFVKIKLFNNTTYYTREDDEIIDVIVLDE